MGATPSLLRTRVQKPPGRVRSCSPRHRWGPRTEAARPMDDQPLSQTSRRTAPHRRGSIRAKIRHRPPRDRRGIRATLTTPASLAEIGILLPSAMAAETCLIPFSETGAVHRSFFVPHDEQDETSSSRLEGRLDDLTVAIGGSSTWLRSWNASREDVGQSLQQQLWSPLLASSDSLLRGSIAHRFGATMRNFEGT